MKLDLPVHTFNSYGGSSRFGPVIALFELAEEDFGPALQEIELTLCFRSKLPFSEQGVHRSLRESFTEFHEVRCRNLPTRRFLRRKAQLKIEVLADFACAEDMRGWGEEFCLEWQPKVLDILRSELEQCRRKFRSTDDFRFSDFLGWLGDLDERLPCTQEAAKALDDQWRRFSDERHAQMSEWDRLGIDWDDYHPDARDIVTDPRLWSTGHDFAPNGNDSGADLISEFRSQKSRWARDSGRSFYRNLALDWGFTTDAPPGDSSDYNLNREVVLGLAFAFLKLLAYCPEWLAEHAISEIRRYRKYLEHNHQEWPHRDECLEYHAIMLDCLSTCPRR